MVYAQGLVKVLTSPVRASAEAGGISTWPAALPCLILNVMRSGPGRHPLYHNPITFRPPRGPEDYQMVYRLHRYGDVGL
jgi:hypothetical protein